MLNISMLNVMHAMMTAMMPVMVILRHSAAECSNGYYGHQ
jgi:hypothetical protein